MPPSAITGQAARAAIRAGRLGWNTCRRTALRVRAHDAYTPPWSASVLDDVALNRPWNLLLRALRLRARARLSLPGPLGARPGVTIVIVNWNGATLVPAVLRAIERYSPDRPDVIVVDNASSAWLRAWLRTQRHRLVE